MADKFGRKKSYRWVSASQASYDGSEWDSDDDGGYTGSGSDLKRGDTISNLPALPKLNYQDYEEKDEKEPENVDNKDDDLTDEAPEDVPEDVPELPEVPKPDQEAARVQSFAGDDFLENYYENSVVSQSKNNEDDNSDDRELDRREPESLPTDEHQEDFRGNEEGSDLELTTSRDSFKNSLPQKTPVNEDLDKLMAQISREMEQQQENSFSNEDGDLNASPEEHGGEEEEELGVSKTGYFSNLVHSDRESDKESDKESAKSPQHDSEIGDYSPENHLEKTVSGSSLSSFRSSKETEQEPNQNHERENIGGTPPPKSSTESPEPPERSPLRLSQHSPLPSQRSSLPLPQRSPLRSPAKSSLKSPESFGSSFEDSEDDALSFTNSLKYHGTADGDADEYDDADDANDINEDEDEASDAESVIRVHKSGYFGKMVSRDDDDDDDDDDGDSGDDNADAETIRRGDDSGDEKEEGVFTEAQDKNSLMHAGDDDNNNDDHDSKNSKTQVRQSFTENAKRDKDDAEEPAEAEEGKRSLSGQKSVNMGGWRPDIGVARSGFLQETSKKAPPGYVYDENGELVNLTPSSMKQRAVSTYSEAESAWNPFPGGNEDGDLQTIGDTKTIYDNQTIYNVPGLITNNQNLPPLPNLDSESNLVSEPTDSNGSLTVGSSIATLSEIDGGKDKGPLRSHFQEVLNSSTPNLNEDPLKGNEIEKTSTAKTITEDSSAPKTPVVTTSATVPSLDLNKVISGKSSHAHKIQELQHYYDELVEHDSGLYAWIEASLKSPAVPDKGYLFEQYKVSKHVKDAYANADELSKKHTVTNTVASVNQNVNQLKKKVFSHPMKSRGLFSAIGKKKI